MAYGFQNQATSSFVLNAYNADKNVTLKNIGVKRLQDDNAIVTSIISFLTIAGAQSLFTITDSKRVLDQRVVQSS